MVLRAIIQDSQNNLAITLGSYSIIFLSCDLLSSASGVAIKNMSGGKFSQGLNLLVHWYSTFTDWNTMQMKHLKYIQSFAQLCVLQLECEQSHLHSWGRVLKSVPSYGDPFLLWRPSRPGATMCTQRHMHLVPHSAFHFTSTNTLISFDLELLTAIIQEYVFLRNNILYVLLGT